MRRGEEETTLPSVTETFLPVITGIVLMVPEARAVTEHAHVTLLAPFGADQGPTPGELAEVAEYFADQAPFEYRLTDVAEFPDGTRYLAVDPAARFRRMTHDLHRLFPEYPPYAGTIEVVVPHLTIPADAVVGPLPIVCHAREATLLHVEDGAYTERGSFPLGASVA